MSSIEDQENAVYRTLGANIRIARKLRNLNQSNLGEAVGLSRSSVANVEVGRQRPMPHTVLAIARALGVDIGALFDAATPPQLTGPEPSYQRGYRRGWAACLTAVRKTVNSKFDPEVPDD